MITTQVTGLDPTVIQVLGGLSPTRKLLIGKQHQGDWNPLCPSRGDRPITPVSGRANSADFGAVESVTCWVGFREFFGRRLQEHRKGALQSDLVRRLIVVDQHRGRALKGKKPRKIGTGNETL
jgi:hypothetical protein